MAFTPPEELPETEEELDDALAVVYKQGIESGKKQLRAAMREYLTKRFLAAKGRDRRANPDDPKIQAMREIMEAIYTKFEDGSL